MTSTSTANDSGATSKATLWAGRILSGIVIAILGISAVMKLAGAQQVVENFTGQLGYRAGALPVIGVIEVLVAVIYAVPKTRVLGAILATGYLGGAIATHVRIDDPKLIVPLVLGIFAWGGLYFRSERLRSLLPLVN